MSFKNVIGQTSALRMLGGAIKRGRISSSYLFAGEQGIGKKFTALNFAKTLNCLNPDTDGPFGDSCDSCPSCKKIDSGIHPDVSFIAPSDTGQIKVEEIRRLEEMLSMKASESKVKVAIVDDAETMNQSAANAFLKTLEEPPQCSLIILVSSSPDMLPSTVRSRCSRVNFSPLSPADCEKVLGKASPALIGLSMGRPGLAAADYLIKERDRFIDTLGGAGEKHPWKGKGEMERWFDMALLYLRDRAVVEITGDERTMINSDIPDAFGKRGSRASLEDIMACYLKLLRLRSLMGFNLNKGITWNYAMALVGRMDAGGALIK